MPQWIKINDFQDIPFGASLCTVKVSADSDPKVVVMHVAKDASGNKIGYSGNCFYFDFHEIMAYTECPEPFKSEEK